MRFLYIKNITEARSSDNFKIYFVIFLIDQLLSPIIVNR